MKQNTIIKLYFLPKKQYAVLPIRILAEFHYQLFFFSKIILKSNLKTFQMVTWNKSTYSFAKTICQIPFRILEEFHFHYQLFFSSKIVLKSNLMTFQPTYLLAKVIDSSGILQKILIGFLIFQRDIFCLFLKSRHKWVMQTQLLF